MSRKSADSEEGSMAMGSDPQIAFAKENLRGRPFAPTARATAFSNIQVDRIRNLTVDASQRKVPYLKPIVAGYKSLFRFASVGSKITVNGKHNNISSKSRSVDI